MPAQTAEKLLTGHEVAAILGRNPQTIRIYARTGRIGSVKVGPHYRFKKAHVEAYLAAHETPAPNTAPKSARSPRYSK